MAVFTGKRWPHFRVKLYLRITGVDQFQEVIGKVWIDRIIPENGLVNFKLCARGDG